MKLLRSLKRSLLMSIPVIVFAATLALLQWFSGDGIEWSLPIRTILVFLVVTTVVRLLPWVEWLERLPPRGRVFHAVLFFFLIRHFVLILGTEAHRAMVARRMAVPNEFGPAWFSSLRGAVSGILRRSLIRAERFYMAQSIRGIE